MKSGFEQCPAMNLDYPPRTPGQIRLYRHAQSNPNPDSRSVTQCINQSSATLQVGPRSPPWGSYHTLEMQRRQRGETRERTQALMYRRLQSTQRLDDDGYGKSRMRREVDEYREQVLGVYPDMEFNREAGKSGVEYCCILM